MKQTWRGLLVLLWIAAGAATEPAGAGEADSSDLPPTVVRVRSTRGRERSTDRDPSTVRRTTVVRRRGDKSDGERLDFFYNAGCMLMELGEYRKAERAFLRALEMDPGDVDTHYNLGIVYDDGLGDADRARHHYREFLRLSDNEQDRARVDQWLEWLL